MDRSPPEFFTVYNPPPPVDIDTGTDTFTKQEFKDDCDVNRIMARAMRSGVVPANENPGLYGDFSEVADYQQAQDILLHARAQFDGLPATVRDRFKNDPAQLLAFVSDPDNIEEARKLGIANPAAPAPVKPVPMEVVVIPNPDGSSPVLK